MQTKHYQIISKTETRKLSQFLCKDGQFLLPIVDLISQAEMAVDELIDVVGRAAIEAVLTLSAQQVAGPKHPGRSGGDLYWYGRQSTVVPLSDRKLRLDKPRLRRKGRGHDKEVQIPAYEALWMNSKLSARMLEVLMNGISTRNYKQMIPQMAETVGVSKSSVSRQFIEASEQQLKELCERRFDDRDILVVYIDGLQFGQIHVIVAIRIDA